MFSKISREHLFLTFILLLGFLVRFLGVGFGLPDLYHADEPIVVNHALAYGTGDFNPHFFKIPPLVSYLLFICYSVYYVIGRAVGFFSGLEDFQNLFLSDPSSFYLIGRIVFGVLCGTGTIYVFYRLLDRFFSRTHAIFGSFLFAFSFLQVRDSHYIYCDIPLLMVLVSCFFPIFQILSSRGWKNYLRFGFLAGIAVATKYNGILIVAPFLTAHFLRARRSKSRVLTFDLFIALVVSFLVYSLLNLFSWLDFHFFWNELHEQARAEAFSGFFHHLVYSLNGGLSFPILVFSIVDMLILIFRPEVKRFILLSFILAYYSVLGFFSQPYDRYVLLLIPFFVFFAADGLIYVKQKLRLTKVLWLSFLCAMVLLSVAKVCLSNYIFLQRDVRDVAREWVEHSVPFRTKVALDGAFYMPRLQPTITQLFRKREEILSRPSPEKIQLKRIDLLIELARNDLSQPRYEVFFLKESEVEEKFLFAKPTVPYDVAALKKIGIQYVITYQGEKPRNGSFSQDLEKHATLVAKFTPYKNQLREWSIDRFPLTGGPFLWSELVARERNGQILKIYRLS